MFINLNKSLLVAVLLMLATSCQPIGTDTAKKKVEDAVAKEILPTVINFSQKEIFIPENAQDLQNFKIQFNQDAVAVLSAVNTKKLDISFVTDHPELISFPKQQHISINIDNPIIESGFILPIKTSNKPGKAKIWANINSVSSATKTPIMTANRKLSIVDDTDKILSINNRFRSVSLSAYSDFPNDSFSVDVKSSSATIEISSLTKSFNFSFDQIDSPITYQIDYSVSNFDKPQQVQIIAASPKLINATFYPIICWNDKSIQILNSKNLYLDYITDLQQQISGKIVNCSNTASNIELGIQESPLNPDLNNKIAINPTESPTVFSESVWHFNISFKNIESLSELPSDITIYAKTPEHSLTKCPGTNIPDFLSCLNLQIKQAKETQFKDNITNLFHYSEHDSKNNLLVHYRADITNQTILNFRIEYIDEDKEQYIVGDTAEQNSNYFIQYNNDSILINGKMLKPNKKYILYAYSIDSKTGIQNDIGFTYI
jgi:hypothetical protein